MNKIGDNLQYPGLGEVFLHLVPKAEFMKGNTDKLDFIKITNFCPVNGFVKNDENIAIDWAKILAKPKSKKGLVSKIHKELSKLIMENNNNKEFH